MPSNVILLVEDNPDDVILIRRTFQKAGCRHAIVVVPDGAAAIAHLFPAERPAPAPPALVLLDLKLPRVDGAEVLRRLRGDAQTRLVPVRWSDGTSSELTVIGEDGMRVCGTD